MNVMRGLVSLLGRLLIVPIFLLSAVGNKIPRFSAVAESMAQQGVPEPRILLAGAIAFLILGSLSIALGYRARVGALMLLVFLGAATYYFHDFWTMPAEAQQEELIAFMKNVSLMGAMLFIIGNGAGPMSLDSRRAARRAAASAEQPEHEPDDDE